MRRPIRRRPPPGRPLRRAPHPALEAARRELVRANRLLESGKHVQAAEIFARLSGTAEHHGALVRASNLAARSAHAFMLGADIARAQVQARRAIKISILAGDLPCAVRLAQRTLAELEANGYSAEAETLRAEFDQRLSQLGLSLADGPPRVETGSGRRQRDLPAQCPACLGPVRSDEVEWIDDTSVQCAYCGSIIKAQ